MTSFMLEDGNNWFNVIYTGNVSSGLDVISNVDRNSRLDVIYAGDMGREFDVIYAVDGNRGSTSFTLVMETVSLTSYMLENGQWA